MTTSASNRDRNATEADNRVDYWLRTTGRFPSRDELRAIRLHRRQNRKARR